jgi:hypothetical protein
MIALWQVAADSDVLSELPTHQKFVAVAMGLAMLGTVLELVRRRKLREEFAYLWIGTAVLLMALALEPRLLYLFQVAIGATKAVPTLFSGALVFLMLVSLMISVRLSRLTFRNKRLNRELSLQQQELEELRAKVERLERESLPTAQSKAKGGAA